MRGGIAVTTAPWTGTLSRGTEPNTVVVVVRDTWGWEITLRGERAADGTYPLAGDIGPPPACLRVPALDDAK